MTDRPRLLLVTRNLPPLVGGMERLNWHMADELAKVAQVRIVGPQGCAAMAPAGIQVRQAPLKPLWKFLLQATHLARREARRWQPQTVLAGSGLTAPMAWLAARACGARSAVYVHGLDIAIQHPVYRAVWLPAIRRMDTVIANSHPTAALCRGIGVESERIVIVHPGVELPIDAVSPSDHRAPVMGQGTAAEDFRKRHKLGQRPLLLSVGRLSTRKGLREFVRHALPLIVAEHPQAMLLVIGDAPCQALHAQAQTPDSIQAAATASGVGDNLRFLGKVPDGELSAAYRACDVHVFPVRDLPGDPEGFGMVAVEAAAHGLPTVAFATGGIVDAVAQGRSGYLVVPGDYPALATAVNRMLAGNASLRASSAEFALGFAWPEFGRKVAGALQSPPMRSIHPEGILR